MQEKRRYIRWQVSRPAHFRLVRDTEYSNERIAQLRDISFTGAQVSFSENLRLNDKLDMSIAIPDENAPLHCQARVIWQRPVDEQGVQPFICGLYFTQIKSRDRDKLFQYVRTTLLKAGETNGSSAVGSGESA
jgi:c-di-GMP-binding flagellar brake protein YcgR